MDAELVGRIAEKVSSSQAGRDVAPGVVTAAVRWALSRHAPKDAEKAAKSRLHQLYGSYVAHGWLKDAGRVLDALEAGSPDARAAAERLLALHGSTRERLPHIAECYERIFAACGVPGTVLDVASGLNPLSFCLLGLNDITLLAQDAGAGVVTVLNRFFRAALMPNARAEAGDALSAPPRGRFDVALVMKFLPLAERIEKGGALRLLDSIDARHVAVSFPTRSLSGRNVGMEKNYSEWFEQLGFNGDIVDRFVHGGELFYIVKPSR